MTLEYAAAWWMKWEKRCSLVMMERSPRDDYSGRPDVIGLTGGRFLLEIEIKRTLPDLKANFKKTHVERRSSAVDSVRTLYLRKAPQQFWFLVPRELVAKAGPLVPADCGLMTVNDSETSIVVLRPAPKNPHSTKLTPKECARMMQLVGNQYMSWLPSRICPNHYTDSTAMDSFYHGSKYYEGYVNWQI